MFLVMINDTIKKYKNKEKHKIYMEILVGKNHGQRRKFYYEFERNYKVRLIGNKPYFFFSTFSVHKSRTVGLRVEYKPKTKFGSQK